VIIRLAFLLTMSARCADCLNEAIERCEVTGVPLCAAHLWYAEDGRRISERVARQLMAQGKVVYSPDTYLNKLGRAATLPRLPAPEPPRITQQRNSSDVVALLAGISGILSIATCFGIGLAICIPPFPLLPLLLGGIGLASARHAARPRRARLLSWLGIVGGAGFLVIAMLGVVAGLAFGVNTLLTPVLPPATPAPVPTPTPIPGP
jgi:thiol:disulfide interchange protein